MNLTEGQILSNRYRLLKPLGQGGFSVVWLVEDTVSGTEAAIKIYAPDKGLDQDGLEQFRKEYGRTRGLQHPHLLVPDHLDILPDSRSPFLKMRYCSNGSLNSWIVKEKRPAEQEVAKLLEQVGSGLAHLHKKGVIHQDIKPDNILIDASGDFLLTDFGISRQMQSTLKKATANQSYMTVSYSPPERFIADPVDAPAGDLFSLGVALYELCTGDLPWDGAGGMILNTGAQVPNLPESYSGRLNKIVKACMDVDYTKRPTAVQLVSLGRGFLKEGYWGEVQTKEQPAAKPKGRKTQKKSTPVGADATSLTETEVIGLEMALAGRSMMEIVKYFRDSGMSLKKAKEATEKVLGRAGRPELQKETKPNRTVKDGLGKNNIQSPEKTWSKSRTIITNIIGVIFIGFVVYSFFADGENSAENGTGQDAASSSILNEKSAHEYAEQINRYLDLEEYQRAEKLSEEAIEIYPEEITFLMFLTQIYYYQQKWDDGYAAAKQVVELEPNNTDMRWLISLGAYNQLSDSEEKLYELYDDLYTLSFELRTLNDSERERALNDELALQAEIETLENEVFDLYDRAIQHLEAAVNIDSNDVESIRVLGVFNHNMATIYYEKRDVTPDDQLVDVYNNQAEHYAVEAKEYYQTVVNMDPENSDTWESLSNIYFQLGKFEEAENALKNAD